MDWAKTNGLCPVHTGIGKRLKGMHFLLIATAIMLRHGTKHDTGLGGCRNCQDPGHAFTYIMEVLESCPFERVAFNPCQPPFIQVRSPSKDVAFIVALGSSRKNFASRLDMEGMQAIKTHAAQTLHRITIGQFWQAEADRWLHACIRIDPGPA